MELHEGATCNSVLRLFQSVFIVPDRVGFMSKIFRVEILSFSAIDLKP